VNRFVLSLAARVGEACLCNEELAFLGGKIMTFTLKTLLLTTTVIAAPLAVTAEAHGDNLNYVLVSHAPDSEKRRGAGRRPNGRDRGIPQSTIR
jgi:hypothetical protein